MNRGDNEASRREARVAHEGKTARKLNSHFARLGFLARISPNQCTLQLFQTVNTGIISGLMLCSQQNKRNFSSILVNRGENEASWREVRVAQEGKTARKLNSHSARLAFLARLSLPLICSPKNTQKITPILQVRCFCPWQAILKESQREVSARNQVLVKWSALGKSTNYCKLLRIIVYQEKVDHLAKHLIKLRYEYRIQDTVFWENLSYSASLRVKLAPGDGSSNMLL